MSFISTFVDIIGHRVSCDETFVNECRVHGMTSTARHRSRTGRRPGPTATRETILGAARRRFAEVGYDRATFRVIAAEAGVDPALIVQFFGSKQDLFLAAVRWPPERREWIGEQAAADPDAAGERVARMLVGWLEDPEDRSLIMARIRSAASEPAAAELVRQAVSADISEIARRLGGDRPDLRAGLVASQFVGLLMAREIVGLESLVRLSGDELVTLVAPTLQRYLTGPLGEG
jgi:AcrR family transcriptional regulator